MAYKLKLGDIAKASRLGKCEALNFILDTGEIVPGACRRRNCPLCWPSWAYHTSKALSLTSYITPYWKHGAWIHIMLTLDDSYINEFPTEAELHARHLYSRKSTTHIDRRKLAPFIPEIRAKIHESGRRVSLFTERLRTFHGHRRGFFPPYGRIVETGTKGTHRWHVHYICFIDKRLFCNSKGKLVVNPLGFVDSTQLLAVSWPYGGVRAKELYNGPRGLKYLSAYATKQSHGRFVMDRLTSRVRRSLYEKSKSQTPNRAVGTTPRSDDQYFSTSFNRDFQRELTRRIKNGHLRIDSYYSVAEIQQLINSISAGITKRR